MQTSASCSQASRFDKKKVDVKALRGSGIDERHAMEAAQAMIEIDKHKKESATSRQVAQRVNRLGHGGSLRAKIAEFADVRNDVRASKAPKRKRKDAKDIRTDHVQSYLYEYTQPGGQPGLMQLFTPHRPNFVLERTRSFGHEPSATPSLSAYKKKKRKHEGDRGFRGY